MEHLNLTRLVRFMRELEPNEEYIQWTETHCLRVFKGNETFAIAISSGNNHASRKISRSDLFSMKTDPVVYIELRVADMLRELDEFQKDLTQVD